MPKAFTDKEKAIIQQRLLAQGLKLFGAAGLKKASIEALTAAAGISKAAFYIFYPSKEALFMDVVEQVERDFRRQVLAEIELPGPSPRRRLAAVFQRAFTTWKSVPILHTLTLQDYELLTQRVPAETIQAHLQSDREFIFVLAERCRQAGIPITADPEQMDTLMHALFFVTLHETDLGPEAFAGTIEILVDLVAAYCLGEVETMPV